MAFGEIFLRDTACILERGRQLHFARSGSQSQCAIFSILTSHGASHINNKTTKGDSVGCLGWGRENIALE